jgi:hypothetical protein
MFLAILTASALILSRLSHLGALAGEEHIQAGYLAAARAQLLMIGLAVALGLVPLLYQGLFPALALWPMLLLGIGFFLPGPVFLVANSRLFVAPLLNFTLLLLLPLLAALALYWSAKEFRQFQLVRRFFQFALAPSLWLLVVVVTVSGNLFFWHWSSWFAQDYSVGLGWVLLGGALPLFITGGKRQPIFALLCYWLGLLLPLGLFWLIWDNPDAALTALTMLLPGFGRGFLLVWLELLLVFALPVLIVLGVNQWFAWKQGSNFIELF